MHRDDRMSGRVLTRREALAVLGAAGMALAGAPLRPAFAQAVPACVVTPEQTEGPFFSDVRLHRADIRSDPTDNTVKEGVPLAVAMRVYTVSSAGCTPLAGARVDLWQCDAAGVYSDARDASADTRGKLFLRGYQLTDANGAVRFATIYPGGYPGRAVHLHFKVRSTAGVGRRHEFTSQLYFDDAVTDRVHARAPYAAHGRRARRNSEDGIYRRGGGSRLMLALAESGAGYVGEFSVGLAV
jgi:protocatechuate 3,4-dioxygenase beta subunit